MKKIILNNLLITLIFFFVLEIFLRTFGLSDLRGHGNELKKKQTNVETTVFGKKVFLNQYGYRVPNSEFSYNESINKIISENVRTTLEIPSTIDDLSPFLMTIPLQLLAYHVASLKNCDIDKPRNLAKSVTVE